MNENKLKSHLETQWSQISMFGDLRIDTRTLLFVSEYNLVELFHYTYQTWNSYV